MSKLQPFRIFTPNGKRKRHLQLHWDAPAPCDILVSHGEPLLVLHQLDELWEKLVGDAKPLPK